MGCLLFVVFAAAAAAAAAAAVAVASSAATGMVVGYSYPTIQEKQMLPKPYQYHLQKCITFLLHQSRVWVLLTL